MYQLFAITIISLKIRSSLTLKFLKEHIQHASLSAFPAENLFPSFVPPPSDHHPGNPRQTKKALGYPGEKGPRYRMKVERRCMAREHTLRGHHGRSMVDHDGGHFASLPPFFSRYRLISMHHREGTGSEAAALAQHAISERHRWTEVVDYLQHKAGWIREKKCGSVIPPIENSFIFMRRTLTRR